MKAKILIATYRGPPEGSGRFFSEAVQPFLDESVRRQRRKGLVVYEAMLYRFMFDFRSAAQTLQSMGEFAAEKTAMLQLGLDSSTASVNLQLAETLGVGKPLLLPMGLGFEEYVRRVNYFSKNSITSVVEPQDAAVSFLHAEASALGEALAGISAEEERLDCMARLIRLLSACRAVRAKLLTEMISSELERDPSLAIALPRGPWHAGIRGALDERCCEIHDVSDGSFMDFAEQAAAGLDSGRLDERGLRQLARLQLSYLDFLSSHPDVTEWRGVRVAAALHAAAEEDGPK